MNDKKMMQIVGAVERTVGEEKKAWWTKIGVAFQNTDGSWNLLFEYLPARLADTTIQLREMKPRDAAPSEYDRGVRAAARPPDDRARGPARDGACAPALVRGDRAAARL
jgi:hypothetical protein